MFRKYYYPYEEIDPISNFLFEYEQDVDTDLIVRKGLRGEITYLGFLLILLLICLFSQQ